MENIKNDIKRQIECTKQELREKIMILRNEVDRAIADLDNDRYLNSCGVFQNTQQIEVLAGRHYELMGMLKLIKSYNEGEINMKPELKNLKGNLLKKHEAFIQELIEEVEGTCSKYSDQLASKLISKTPTKSVLDADEECEYEFELAQDIEAIVYNRLIKFIKRS